MVSEPKEGAAIQMLHWAFRRQKERRLGQTANQTCTSGITPLVLLTCAGNAMHEEGFIWEVESRIKDRMGVESETR